MIGIREATEEDISVLYTMYEASGKKDEGYFEQCMGEGISIFIASVDGKEAGFCLLNWHPRYSLYKKLDIPEIQDLNVVPGMRRNGVATALIKWCEGLARAKGKDTIGIGVGLTRDYGPAQILYTRLGYVPDGFGITHDREAVVTHALYRMDDDLSLMMIKQLF